MQDRKWVYGWGNSAHHCHPHSHCACHSASVQGCTLLHGYTWKLKVHRNYLQQKQIAMKICFHSLLNEFLPCKGSVPLFKQLSYTRHFFSFLILTRILWGTYKYLHFTNEETEALRGLGICPGFKLWLVWLWGPAFPFKLSFLQQQIQTWSIGILKMCHLKMQINKILV